MGRFRKAAQLSEKVAELSQKLDSIEHLSEKNKELIYFLFPDLFLADNKVKIKIVATSFPNDNNDGKGFVFQIFNETALIEGHVKFHSKGEDDPNQADISAVHLVIERVKYLKEKGSMYELRFDDDTRDGSNHPVHGNSFAYVNDQKKPVPQQLSRLFKPRLDMTVYKSENDPNLHCAIRPRVQHAKNGDFYTYRILKHLYENVTPLQDLFHITEDLFKKFSKVIVRDWQWLFKEDQNQLIEKALRVADPNKMREKPFVSVNLKKPYQESENINPNLNDPSQWPKVGKPLGAHANGNPKPTKSR